ncbi:restriction endonuclease subunit S [Vibrio cholerae]|uniref:restriction endonuclease subunit S n=1 Tax=Vibrio cholerae TaxID=666 RepID=UPI000DF3C041|nr:restriction endonuclease subunit S [Vibrio parahaemolyticus]RCW21322.1 type I restriction enzyme S subunit [Vibrio parahaemolyticus]
MSKQYFKKGLPQLRFLEFKDGPEWSQKKLSDPKVAIFVKEKGKVSSLTLDTYISTENILPDYQGVVTASKLPPSGSFTLYKNNDVLISNIRPYLKKVWHADKVGAASNDILVIRAGSDIKSLYLLYLLKNDNFIDYMMSSAKGVKMPRGDIESIRNYPVFVPEREEQTKIAECLSSLDDVIITNNKKLDSLKLHKKGLLQKLFPAEGKDIPELRFDGFEGEWEEVELRKLGDLISGLTYSPDDVRASGLLVLRSSNVQNGKIVYEDNVFVEPNIKGANISKPDDILICVRNGSKALIGKNALIPQNVPLSTHGAFMTIFRSKYAQFTFQLFQTNAYQKQVDADLGATINSINGKQLLKYKFKIPRSNDEKEIIVKCLSSLDDLINAQTDKIEVLKEYKKGLMQQLFPEMKESIA